MATISMAATPASSMRLWKSRKSAKAVPGPHKPSRVMYAMCLGSVAPVADTYTTCACPFCTFEKCKKLLGENVRLVFCGVAYPGEGQSVLQLRHLERCLRRTLALSHLQVLGEVALVKD